ncbi:MAG: hypothetical protein ACXVNM_01620 [Bacteroidia bacterium]
MLVVVLFVSISIKAQLKFKNSETSPIDGRSLILYQTMSLPDGIAKVGSE